ncbi:MAG: enoyl-CoA hydratase/isomerase family protein [Gemmatimonadaceae bacterium]
MNGTVLTDDPVAGVRVITLNRPARLNAVTPELVSDLTQELSRANHDSDIRAIVLTGAGRAFCSGDDLKEFGAPLAGEAELHAYIDRIQDVTRLIVLGDKPVIAAIHGWAVGAGLEWMINCDFAIAAEGSRFFFPEVRLGLFVTGAVTALLPRMISPQKARELIYLGERFDAAQALEWGMLWKVVPPAQVLSEATDLARRIAELPPRPVRDLKRILARATSGRLEDVLTAECAATVQGFLDPESAKRVADHNSANISHKSY